MANIKSFPNNQDEYIGAEDVMRWLHGRSSGVFGADGNASVAPVLDAMAVTVSDGNGWMSNDNADGVVWWIDNESASGSKLQLAVDMADAVFTRIDRVVVSWQTTNYVARPEVTILKGVAAANPTAPALTNNNILRQISLASIRIPAGATKITAAMITDERLDDSVCGLVTCGIGVDTSVMQAQFETFWAENIAGFEAYREQQTSDLETYMERQKTAWETFLESFDDGALPVPTEDDAGKVIKVNDTYDGYVLGDAQMEIPITSEVPEDSDIWIDPSETSFVDDSHIANMNNPHGTTAEQVGARPDNWMPTAADVGARPSTWTPTASDVGAVPTTRTVNNKALSSNISLFASDVGAVPTSRTVNSKALSSNITLSASDVGALPTTGGTVSGGVTFNGNIILGTNSYGTKLPTAGTKGRVFFKKVSS